MIVNEDFSPKASPLRRQELDQTPGVGVDGGQLQMTDILPSRQGSHI